MSPKLKIVLGILIVVGVFIVFKVGGSMTSAVFNANISNSFNKTPVSLDETYQDSDQDGLSDQEEIYWDTDPYNPDTDGDGFLDGEEVASNCSPLKPAPNDCKSNSFRKTNLTQKSINILAGGLVEGAFIDANTQTINPTSQTSSNTISEISQDVIDDFFTRFPVFTEDTLKTTSDTSRASVIGYIQKVRDFTRTTVSKTPEQIAYELRVSLNYYELYPDKRNPYFVQLAREHKEAYQNLINTTVPNGWTKEHIELVNSVYSLYQTFDMLSTPDIDPISAKLSLSVLPVGYKKVADAFEVFKLKVESYI